MIFFAKELYIEINDGSIVPVEIFNEYIELEEDKAYIFNDKVYLFRGDYKTNRKKMKNGIYIKDGERIIVEDGDDDIYYTDRILKLDADKIFSDIAQNVEQYKELLSSDVVDTFKEKYIPPLKPNDDFLKTIIKLVLRGKDVDYKIYKNKLPKKNELENKMSSIKSDTKVSIPVFLTWKEILNFTGKIIITDNGKDKTHPLKSDIVIDLDDF